MKTLAAKLCDIMAECKNIPKNGKNAFHNYKYVKAADAAEYIREAMVKHGVIALPNLMASRLIPFKTRKGEDNFLSEVEMKYTFINADDSSDRFDCSVLGSGSDSSDKAEYKAMTGAHKYFLMQSFTLGGDDDPEKDEKPRPQAQPLKPAAKPLPAQTGKQPKDLNAEQLEWLRHNGKTPEQRRAAEDEISRREELAFNQQGA